MAGQTLGNDVFQDSQPDAQKGTPGEGAATAADASAGSSPAQGRGPLLDKSPEDAAKIALGMYQAQRKSRNKRRARWQVNRLRRSGMTHVRLQRSDQNIHEWQVYVPPGAAFLPPTMNKAARLGRKLVSNMLVDPPVPEATPASDSDEDRDDAEFTTRCLQDLGSESGFNNLGTISRSFDLAFTHGSGFRFWYSDPMGGGQRPQQIMASPKAADVSAPLLDATTGQIDPGDHVMRYVGKDGKTIVDDAKQAALQWLPKLKVKVYSGRNITFLPESSTGMENAKGIQVAEMVPLGDVRQEFNLNEIADADISKLTWRPEQFADLLPSHVSKDQAGGDSGSSKQPGQRADGARPGMPGDDALIFVLRTFYSEGPQYAGGCEHVLLGEGITVRQEDLVFWTEEGCREVRIIPLDQLRMFREGDDDPYGYGGMDLLGSGNEVRASTFGSLIEHLDRFNRRKVFYPIAGSLQPKHLQNPMGTYIPMSPGGQPVYEQIPEYPRSATDMLERTDNEMDDDIGLTPVAQGVNPPNVGSGLHAQQLIEQSNVNLSGIKQNIEEALTRGWRIAAQLVKATYTVEQQIGWTDDDGEYKQESFVGADLGSTKDIRIQRGSFTLLSPSAKAALAQSMFQMNVLSLDELKRVTWGNVGGLLGLQDNPHLLRVRRQISAWLDGPPDAVAQDPTQWPAALALIWDRRPSDLLTGCAEVRFTELARLTSGSRYKKMPDAWRSGADAEFNAMKQAAGVQTVADQQQAQQGQPDPALETVLSSLVYAQAPKSIQNQIEAKLGLTPSPVDELSPQAAAAQLKSAQDAQAGLASEGAKRTGNLELISAKGREGRAAGADKHAQAMAVQAAKHTQDQALAAADAQAAGSLETAKQQGLAQREAMKTAAVAGAPPPGV